MKLADIRAENKIWIYLPKNHKNQKKTKDDFSRVTKEFGDYLKGRKEKVSPLGQFMAFLKTPKKVEKGKVSY